MNENPMFKSFSQRDTQWAAKVMPPSTLTLGRYGCTTTCIADLSTYFGDNLTPARIADLIRFTVNGLIVWQTCNFAHFAFDRREIGRNDANIQAAINDPNRAVILEVAHGTHWVVAIDNAPGNMYRIADPWLGDKTSLARYNGNITGAAYFKRKYV